MGRPKIVIDEALVEKLASIHCTIEEIALIVGCSRDTIENRFSALIAKAKATGKGSLRRYQWELARKGNATMLIWLGKQLLGQTDKVAEISRPPTQDRELEYESMFADEKKVSEK